MATLTPYRGLQVVTPDPTGEGGLWIQRDLQSLVNWSPKSVWEQTVDPASTDDQTDDFFPGSLWLRTNVTPPKLFVCQSSAVAAAVWKQILLQVVQDIAPKLGGDLDVNGKKLISAANGDIVVAPNGTGNIVLVPTGTAPKVGVGVSTPNSALEVSGPIATAITTKTAAYTIGASDSVILCNATSGAFTVTLLSAASIAGRQYTIKRTSALNSVTIAAASGEAIDGAATKVLIVGLDSVTVVSDGANWWII